MSGIAVKSENQKLPTVKVGVIAKRPVFKSLKFWIAVAGIILVVAAGGYAWKFFVKGNTPKNAPGTVSQAADTKTYNALTTEQRSLSTGSEFDQAASKWTAFAATTPSAAHKQTAYLDAAALYMSNQEYAKAVSMCKKAEAVSGVTFSEAEVAANAYYALGDKQNAIHYYQEAIRLAPASLSDNAAEKASFKHAIQLLQAQP